MVDAILRVESVRQILHTRVVLLLSALAHLHERETALAARVLLRNSGEVCEVHVGLVRELGLLREDLLYVDYLIFQRAPA